MAEDIHRFLRERASVTIDLERPGALSMPSGLALRSWWELRRAHVRLPGLRCPTCGRVVFDQGGGRACHDPETHQAHGVMTPVWLEARVAGPRDE